MSQTADDTERLLVELISKIDNLGKSFTEEFSKLDRRLLIIENRLSSTEQRIDSIEKRLGNRFVIGSCRKFSEKNHE